MKRLNWLGLTAAALLLAGIVHAPAQNWPNGPVKMFVGFGAGGSTDIIARDIGHELEKVWGQPVIIENRAGANGAIAAGQLAKLPAGRPDADDDRVRPRHQRPPQPEAAVRRAQGLHADRGDRLVAVADLRASELPRERHQVDARARQGEAVDASPTRAPAPDSIQHLSMELLAYLAGVKLTHVPYRSGALALQDTLAGHVPLSVLSVLQALPHLQAKTIKPLAVTSAKATDILPNVPALAEAGLKDYEAELWYVVIAPPGLPPALAAKINADIVKIVKSPAMQKKLADQGARAGRQHRRRGRRFHEGGVRQVGQGHQGSQHQGRVSRRYFWNDLRSASSRSLLPASDGCSSTGPQNTWGAS